MAKKRSRAVLTLGAVALLGAALTAAFWPRPVMVDIGDVARKPMMVTIDEEGRTRVRDTFVVSTPVGGQLLRVETHPGDKVVRGETIVARMLPANPAALDARTREQARAAITSAEAALRVARANLNKAMADKELAFSNLERSRLLFASRTVSEAAVERSKTEARAAEAVVENAEAAISMREAEIETARAQLINFDYKGPPGHPGTVSNGEIPIFAPASGSVLRVIQESATTLPAGAPVMEIGNIENDLEVVVELLSTDAVQIAKGDKVIIADWGGPKSLYGIVERVDPWGFTKTSALGVEEQRVTAVIGISDAQAGRENLGHGYRVEVRIIVWSDDNALTVPSNALFRKGQKWAVFVVKDGTAQERLIEAGQNNGVLAQVTGGLEDGDRVILYPSSGLTSGLKVAQRQVN